MKRLSTAFFATALLLASIVLAALVGRVQDGLFELAPATAEQAPARPAPSGHATNL